MKIAIISKAFPADAEKSVYGMYQRLEMFVHALKHLGELNILFFTEPSTAGNGQLVAETQARLSKRWHASLKLNVCPLSSIEQPRHRWQLYISPALTIHSHPPYLQTSGEKQVAAVRRLLSDKPDVVFVHRLACMIPVLLSKTYHPRIFFDMDDIEHVSFTRMLRQPPFWPAKRLYYLRLPILKKWESRAIRLSRTTFVCSEHDRRYLSSLYKTDNVAVAPNSVDIRDQMALPEDPVLLFLGSFTYWANIQAADYLISKIWPLIRSSLPNARLLIAGQLPEKIPSFASNPVGVEFLGFVENLESLYREVRVVCCPILAGGGTRIKILEAAACGKPIVSTGIGAEGIDLKDQEEIWIRDDPRTFAQACVQLLSDGERAAEIGRAAYQAVSRLYKRENVVAKITNHIWQSLEPSASEAMTA